MLKLPFAEFCYCSRNGCISTFCRMETGSVREIRRWYAVVLEICTTICPAWLSVSAAHSWAHETTSRKSLTWSELPRQLGLWRKTDGTTSNHACPIFKYSTSLIGLLRSWCQISRNNSEQKHPNLFWHVEDCTPEKFFFRITSDMVVGLSVNQTFTIDQMQPFHHLHSTNWSDYYYISWWQNKHLDLNFYSLPTTARCYLYHPHKFCCIFFQ